MSSAAATTRAEEQIASLYDPANNGTIRYDALNRPISVISSAANTASAVGYRQSALTWDTLGRLSTQSIRARNNRARRGLAVMSSSRSQSVTQWGGGVRPAKPRTQTYRQAPFGWTTADSPG